MDYLEGSLLHSWWSDTDYESRRHTGTWFWFSFLTFIAVAYSAYKLNTEGSFGLFERQDLWFTICLTLFFLTPFLALVYYKLPFVLRVPVLALLGLKYVAFFILLVSNVANLLLIPEDLTLSSILEWGNSTFGNFLEDTSNRMGVTGLFLGGGLLVLIGIGVALIILAIVAFLPILLLKGFNTLQYLYDSLVVWLVKKIRMLSDTYKKIPNDRKPKTNVPPRNTAKPTSSVMDRQ